MVHGFEIHGCERLADHFPEPAAVVGPGQEVDHDLLAADFQHPWGLGQFAEMVMIVAVIVIGLLEWLQRLVEQIAGRDFQDVQQTLALAIHFHQLALKHDFQAGLGGLGFGDLRLDFCSAPVDFIQVSAPLLPGVFIALIGGLEGRDPALECPGLRGAWQILRGQWGFQLLALLGPPRLILREQGSL